MMEGIITPRTFNVLDSIRERHGISDLVWAEKVSAISGEEFYATRISEYRRMAKNENAKVGRAFTPHKFALLLWALKLILGDGIVQNEIKTRLAEEEDVLVKCFLGLSSLTPKQLQQTWLYLQLQMGDDS